MSNIDTRDAERLMGYLRELKVPYVMMSDKDPDRYVVITRDTNHDRELVREAFKKMKAQLGYELQQVPVGVFLSANENRQVKHIDGLDTAELEVFKERMKQYQGQYAVVRNTDDSQIFDIYYPTTASHEVENALKDMFYDFSGREGEEYREKINDYLKERDRIKEGLNPREDKVVPDMPESLKKDMPLTSYVHIKRDQLDDILKELKAEGLDKRVAIAESEASYSIAFPENDRIINDKVERMLFGTLKGAERLNAKLYFEGRSESDIDLAGSYIIDAKVRGASIEVIRKGARVMHLRDGNSERLLTLNREDEGYSNALADIITKMQEPVVLSKQEYRLIKDDPEKFNEIIKQRLPSESDNPAEQEYRRHKEQMQRAIYEELHRIESMADAKDLPERSREAMRAYKNREIRETYIDRTFKEKITEMDFSQDGIAHSNIIDFLPGKKDLTRT